MLRKVPILSIFLSTLSLRRATYQDKFSIPSDNISIHALLAESDTPTLESLTPTQTFLSTLSLRRATRPVSALYSVNRYFYPRSPCGERLGTLRTVSVKKTFLSTLSLRRATVFLHFATLKFVFLSTLSLRRATIAMVGLSMFSSYFYPRSPCGERLPIVPVELTTLVFLSTLSLRRATGAFMRFLYSLFISIHALLAESDFQRIAKPFREQFISIHALLAESDGKWLCRCALSN